MAALLQGDIHLNHFNKRRGSSCFLRSLEELHRLQSICQDCRFICPMPSALVSAGINNDWSCPTLPTCKGTLFKIDLIVIQS